MIFRKVDSSVPHRFSPTWQSSWASARARDRSTTESGPCSHTCCSWSSLSSALFPCNWVIVSEISRRNYIKDPGYSTRKAWITLERSQRKCTATEAQTWQQDTRSLLKCPLVSDMISFSKSRPYSEVKYLLVLKSCRPDKLCIHFINHELRCKIN